MTIPRERKTHYIVRDPNVGFSFWNVTACDRHPSVFRNKTTDKSKVTCPACLDMLDKCNTDREMWVELLNKKGSTSP